MGSAGRAPRGRCSRARGSLPRTRMRRRRRRGPGRRWDRAWGPPRSWTGGPTDVTSPDPGEPARVCRPGVGMVTRLDGPGGRWLLLHGTPLTPQVALRVGSHVAGAQVGQAESALGRGPGLVLVILVRAVKGPVAGERSGGP